MNVAKPDGRLFFVLALLAPGLFFFNACSDDDAKPSPSISGFTPDSGVAGDEVTITGNRFAEDAADNIVKFNGVATTVSAASSTSLTVPVPEAATSGKITVTVDGLSGTSTEDFTVLYPPVISSFEPDWGYAGDEVTITGEHFSATASENIVKFNGVAATVNAASATSLTVVVPAGPSGNVKISVIVDGRTAVSVDDFSYAY